ncbi:C2 calcium-dependent domain-containing protein 4C [Pholidichthys leucotaenia]
MWFLGKFRESMESLPLELSHYIGKSEDDSFCPSKTNLSHTLHNNILTPDKIPEFCLPPRLCKRSHLQDVEENRSSMRCQKQISCPSLNSTAVKTNDKIVKNGDTSVVWQGKRKPLPFSAEFYGLAGIYESPNTRRKESLFHSKWPTYMLDRSVPAAAPRLAKEKTLPKKNLSGFLPRFLCKSLSETRTTDSETPSSSDSSPFSSSYSDKAAVYIPSSSGRLKSTVSCPLLHDRIEDRGGWRKGGLSFENSPSSPSTSDENSLTLTPPVHFPLDVLQCQEKRQREHVLPLQGRGKVCLSAEQTTISTSMFRSLFTIRVRVVSVEGVGDDTDQQTLNCVVTLCLLPGKLQQQESATVRNCRSPMFNEDFFFTELSQRDLLELQLKLKVVVKPAAATLKRGTVIGVITIPLLQLLPKKGVK